MPTHLKSEPTIKQRAFKSTELYELAVEVVKDDPKASNNKLISRMASQVDGDDDLRELAVKQVCAHEIVLAKNFLERQKNIKAKQAVKKPNVSLVSVMPKKMVARLGNQILGIVVNGKSIRDMTGDEAAAMKVKDSKRVALWTEVCKRVKGKQIIGKTLTDEQFSNFLPRLGDVSELVELFRS
jgi:hypothetical protein